MIDYQAFKKALVRIAVIAQEKLGGAEADLLAKKLQNDKSKHEEQKKQR